MSNGTEMHNMICNKFRNKNYSKEFIEKYTDEGCSKINKVILEDIISNNNILIGYCDVVINYEDNNGRQQKALIEVKSSAEIINKDPQNVLRQIKKYKFYNKKFTKTFLIYTSEGSYDCVDDEDLFAEEDITIVDIVDFVDSEQRARILVWQAQEREEEKRQKLEDERKKKEEEKNREQLKKTKRLEEEKKRKREEEQLRQKKKNETASVISLCIVVVFFVFCIAIVYFVVVAHNEAKEKELKAILSNLGVEKIFLLASSDLYINTFEGSVQFLHPVENEDVSYWVYRLNDKRIPINPPEKCEYLFLDTCEKIEVFGGYERGYYGSQTFKQYYIAQHSEKFYDYKHDTKNAYVKVKLQSGKIGYVPVRQVEDGQTIRYLLKKKYD